MPAADRLKEATDAVAMGVAPVSDTMPARPRAAVVEGSGQAFRNGLHAASVVTGLLCAAGAVLAAVGIRKSAAGGRPRPVPPAVPRPAGGRSAPA